MLLPMRFQRYFLAAAVLLLSAACAVTDNFDSSSTVSSRGVALVQVLTPTNGQVIAGALTYTAAWANGGTVSRIDAAIVSASFSTNMTLSAGNRPLGNVSASVLLPSGLYSIDVTAVRSDTTKFTAATIVFRIGQGAVNASSSTVSSAASSLAASSQAPSSSAASSAALSSQALSSVAPSSTPLSSAAASSVSPSSAALSSTAISSVTPSSQAISSAAVSSESLSSLASSAAVSSIAPSSAAASSEVLSSAALSSAEPSSAPLSSAASSIDASSTPSSAAASSAPRTNYTVYYYGGAWSAVNIHYTLNGSSWTTPPGVAMTASGGGWWKKDLTLSPALTFCFNNNSDWDSKGGANYSVTSNSPDVWVSNGTILSQNPLYPSVSASPGGGYIVTDSLQIALYAGGNEVLLSRYTLNGSDPRTGADFTNGQPIIIGNGMAMGAKLTLKLFASNAAGVSTAEYTYTRTNIVIDNSFRLGAMYTPASTRFSIWSPDRSDVKVRVNGTLYTMFPTNTAEYPESVYTVDVPGDQRLKEYQFVINGANVRDPNGAMYSWSKGANIVMALASITPDGGWAEKPPLVNREDAIIYEVHVRDFTIDSSSGVPANMRGKFPGMTYGGATYNSTKTGIDHLKELGVTHVQILPMYDFGSDSSYNWGYNPDNYNVPENAYSMTPDDYENRVREVMNMVNEFHKAGIRVIMDVVYNHTAGNDIFSGITDKYFDGLNLSGCGNSVDTGKPMVSRFVQDSLNFWAREYHLDGFRFDLIGIFYVDAVKNWGMSINSNFPGDNILMYGEPWNGMASDPNESQKVRLGKVYQLKDAHVGAFDDQFRGAIKGDSDGSGKGWMFNAVNSTGGIQQGSRGSIMYNKNSAPGLSADPMFAYDPEQAIHYVAAHDNLCLWDKIVKCGENNEYGKKVDRFATGILLTSQGLPFIHGGDEMLRSKLVNGDWGSAANSYSAGDEVNKYRWNWKTDNSATWTYCKDLIALRKAHPALRLTTWDAINSEMTTTIANAQVVYSVINHSGDVLAVVYNAGTSDYSYSLPAGSWKKIAKASGACDEAVSGTVACESTAVTVFLKQ